MNGFVSLTKMTYISFLCFVMDHDAHESLTWLSFASLLRFNGLTLRGSVVSLKN